MEQCFFISLALAALVLPLAGLVVAALALRRAHRLSGRIAALELDIARLRGDLAPEPEDAGSVEGEPGERRPARDEAEPTPQAPPAPPPQPPTAPPFAVDAAPEPARPPSAPDPTPRPAPPARPGRSGRPGRPGVDWERWIGLRGAAAVAGVLLALAGLYFVRYSIEAGWLAPPVRVALGLAAGVVSILASQVLRRRGYPEASNGLAGGGVVVLYAAVWAARSLYDLIPAALALLLMVLITAVCGLLAWRRGSLVVALLGLIGGFATPLLLEAEVDSPLGLFGYLLVLNAGLLLLARHRRWPILPPISLLATLFYEGLWILDRMGPADLPVALAILTLFAALFAATALRRARPGAETGPELGPELGPNGLRRGTGGAAILLPFLFALHFATRADLGEHLWPVAAMLLVLSVGAEWLGRGERFGGGLGNWLGSGAAVASLTVVAVWALDRSADRALAWETTAIAVGLALGFHLFVEIDLARVRTPSPRAIGALLSAGGLLGLLIVDGLVDRDPHPVARLTGWAVLAALLVRQTALPGVRRRQVVAAAVLGTALPLLHLRFLDHPDFPDPALFFGLVVAAAVVLQVLAGARSGRSPAWAAAALPLAALALFAGEALVWDHAAWLFLATTLALALLATLAATRLGSGPAVCLAVLLAALGHTAWSLSPDLGTRISADGRLLGLGAGAVAVLGFTAWPFLARPRLDAERWAWYGAALAGPLWFPALREHWLERFGDAAVGLLAVLLGSVALAAAFRVRTLWPEDDRRRLRGLIWFSAVALGAAALAIPLQLDREWVTVGWALEGVAALALWRRLDHPGLKLFGLALLTTAAARLVAGPAPLADATSGGVPWLAYTHLVPAAALVGGALLLAPVEVDRVGARVGWERRLYPVARPLGSMLAGVAAILVVFVWINRTVFAVFGDMAEDLTLSLAWAAYALILAGLGFVRASRGLRGIGLGLLAVTVFKVFLYDLSGLEDLYRVASLVGLALSLMLVSLAYQRFVFRSSGEDEADPEDPS
ncbi:MAG: DUF2339 domain-containing protein [Acidobacteriota bacterium]|jgi:uncharacterized membrane protein